MNDLNTFIVNQLIKEGRYNTTEIFSNTTPLFNITTLLPDIDIKNV